jgi:hypothetical protein
MLKESIKVPLFTDEFRLIDLLCQSYPTRVVSSSPNAHFSGENEFELIFRGGGIDAHFFRGKFEF